MQMMRLWLFGVGILSAHIAHAAFINGVETFDGTTKDPVTWEEAHGFTSAGYVTQNDFIATTNADYTTRVQTVGVGEGMRFRFGRLGPDAVPSPGASGAASVYLTTNTAGTTDFSIADSRFLGLITRHVTTGTSFDAFDGGGGFIPGPLTNVALLPGDHAGEWFTAQIDRLSLTQARFTVWDDAGITLLGSATRTFFAPPAFPANLYISLNGSAGQFDDVTIVPELATATLMLPAAMLIARRRRRRR